MTAFVVAAAILALLALAGVLARLLRRGARATVVRSQSNLVLLQEQLAELESDLKSGIITAERYHQKGDLAANYLRHGVTLGISSRGVGSLKKVGETNEVQPDFELICFDLVSSPSTPGAYLFSDKNDRMKFEENLEEDKKMAVERNIGSSGNKSLDLMKRLSDYLDK